MHVHGSGEIEYIYCVRVCVFSHSAKLLVQCDTEKTVVTLAAQLCEGVNAR